MSFTSNFLPFILIIIIQSFSDCIAANGRKFEKRQIGGLGIGTGHCLFGLLPPFGGSIQYSQGTQTGPFPEGTSATIICPSGLLPNGPSSSLCMNGFWQPGLGICTGNGLGGIGGIGIGGIGGIGGGQCGTGPATPLNGRLVYSNNQLLGPFPVGTVATVICNAGFVLGGGQSTAVCQQNGLFSPNVLGTCVASG